MSTTNTPTDTTDQSEHDVEPETKTIEEQRAQAYDYVSQVREEDIGMETMRR